MSSAEPENATLKPISSRPLPAAPEIVKILLRGVGQVMFQGHAGTGLLFLAGVAVASPLMLVGALIGAVTGPLVAHLAGFNRQDIQDGIHGFNPTLVGIATIFYLQPGPITWLLLVAGCVAATFVTYAMRKWLKFPSYTAPFVVTTWVLLVAAHALAGTSIDVKPASPEQTPVGFVEEVARGAAEVMFGANMTTGLLFLAGIAISNWRHAALGLLGAVVGTLVALYHGDPQETVSLGIFGYNAVLAAIAIYLWRRSLLLPILAAVISVPLTEFFPKSLGIPPLTAPFVVAAWIVIAIGALGPYFHEGRRPNADEDASSPGPLATKASA